MGLKSLQSIHDLVQGTGPIGNMETQQGPLFDLGSDSTLQINSLDIVPQTSLYQDLNGQQGPSFNFGLNSTLHAYVDTTDSLTETNELPVPGDSIFNLYESSISPLASYNNNWPNVNPTDLSLSEGITPSGMFLTANPDNITELLQQIPNPSLYQDLNGVQGPQFNLGPEDGNQGIIDSLHESSLTSNYAYQHGNSIANVTATTLDLNGQQPPQFNQGPESVGVNQIDTIQETGLEGLYNSVTNPQSQYGAGQQGGAWPVVAPSTLDLNGQEGPQFNLGPEPSGENIDSFHESALIGMYESSINPGASYGQGQPGSTWPILNNTSLAGDDPLSNTPFDNGVGNNQNSLHTDLLENIYMSSINTNSSYGAGQPGGTWPNVSPSPLTNNFADLYNSPEGGFIPNQYLNNQPD